MIGMASPLYMHRSISARTCQQRVSQTAKVCITATHARTHTHKGYLNGYDGSRIPDAPAHGMASLTPACPSLARKILLLLCDPDA